MPTPTYTPLAFKTLTAATTGVTFSSIPSTYRDLVFIGNIKGTTTLVPRMFLNNSTVAGQLYVRITGNGTTATTNSASTTFLTLSSTPTVNTTYSFLIKTDILDYSKTDKHKTIINRANNAANATESSVARWPSTAAVTIVEISASTGQFAIGSTFALYGIAG